MRKPALIGGFAVMALLTFLTPSLGDPDPNTPPASILVATPAALFGNLDVSDGEEITETCDMNTFAGAYTCAEYLGGHRHVSTIAQYFCPPSCSQYATYGQLMVEVIGYDPSFNQYWDDSAWANGLDVGTNPLCEDHLPTGTGNNNYDTLLGSLSDTNEECGQPASGYAAVGATYENPQT